MNTTELAWFKSSYSGDAGDSCVEVALSWYKSSYSGSDGDSCVEVAVSWRKSSYSGSDGDDCVEIAACPTTVHIRDSKDKAGPQLAVPAETWAAFVGYAVELA
ncbi:DUF397 domain-containing protein [Streptomyces tubercidicus]|uniref:DUF397 domain-containing protein n=1 Tax=Streptomyces tubercidicus TaxID=47759 RepID=UPI002E13B7D3|nr:DUF397 domain-containing protein [Streptomyces tubercidicus]WSX20222.1 DUF397 domain-containing protein [Streptomyces tubercidicus]